MTLTLRPGLCTADGGDRTTPLDEPDVADLSHELRPASLVTHR